MTWVERLARDCPLGAISQELLRFDTQLMQDAEIVGVEYQQGALAGYEVREYLLEKWRRRCAYCGATAVPLEVEHIVPRSRGGSNRVSNLTLACRPCNERKGRQTAAECGYPAVQAQAKQPLRDAAAVNATRWALYRQLRATGLSVEVGTGGRTKYNRTRLGLPKAHWLDAACVGASTPVQLHIGAIQPLLIQAMGHGRRQMCRTDPYGFPRAHRARQKRYFEMQAEREVSRHLGQPCGGQGQRLV
jgi:5-methylcytosine-specific restriction endonuclease McrA